MVEQDLYNNMREIVVMSAFGGQQALEPFELTVAQYDALHLLGIEAGQRMGELSGRLLIDNSKMTRIVDYLSEKGWVDRRPDHSDRRAWCLYLTDAGIRHREKATQAHQQYLKEQFAAITAEEQRQLDSLLTTLRRHIAAAEIT